MEFRRKLKIKIMKKLLLIIFYFICLWGCDAQLSIRVKNIEVIDTLTVNDYSTFENTSVKGLFNLSSSTFTFGEIPDALGFGTHVVNDIQFIYAHEAPITRYVDLPSLVLERAGLPYNSQVQAIPTYTGQAGISPNPPFEFTMQDSGLTIFSNRISASIGTAEFQGRIYVSSSAPSSASDTGETGTITWDANYIYICTATNTWKRVAINTW